MREGWIGDDYLILYEGDEIEKFTVAYDIANALPGYSIIGLRGWDDFLVADEANKISTIPTVPLDPKYLCPYDTPLDDVKLVPGDHLAGKIKWYIQPIVFGGSPGIGDNMTWISHSEHIDLVKWWNEQYRYHRSHA